MDKRRAPALVCVVCDWHSGGYGLLPILAKYSFSKALFVCSRVNGCSIIKPRFHLRELTEAPISSRLDKCLNKAK